MCAVHSHYCLACVVLVMSFVGQTTRPWLMVAGRTALSVYNPVNFKVRLSLLSKMEASCIVQQQQHTSCSIGGQHTAGHTFRI